MNLLNILSKRASRKNLYYLIENEIKKINPTNCLNIGAGGDIEKKIKDNVKTYYSIDIDRNRNPTEVKDICSNNFKINFNPNLICAFEVLEHVKNPFKAVENIHSMLKNNDTCLASTPFCFHIHDEPNDYFRYTEYGLRLIFKKFSNVKIIRRNGWLECIFVNIMRLDKEKSILTKLLGKSFILLYWLTYPIIILLQKIFFSEKITTGYFVIAQK
tara:strand:+ start:889 stop:1533 length:645 start_codon:yes stop_codon:yes gene_type:complete